MAEADLKNGHPSGINYLASSELRNDHASLSETNTICDETDTNRADSPLPESTSILGRIFWTPPWCRWDPNEPPVFSMSQNFLFAFAGAFTVANLYYAQPILNVLAREFGVSYLTVSRIPTLCQAGYAVGLLFLCPLGDMLPRRPFVLILVFFTATLWIVLCLTRDFNTFLGVSFMTALTTVTPQIMLPLVGELAPPKKRPFALSIVVSGNLLGIVLARILSGVVTNYTSWRNIYWMALGLQYFIFTLLYLFMPDYPATNPTSLRKFIRDYIKLLLSILLLVRKHPILTQAGMISYCNSASFTAFWTTLTFLLSGEPYNLAPTPIGLFGLIGCVGIVLGPFYARYIIQPLKVPIYSVLLGLQINVVGIAIGTFTGEHTLAGPIIQALLIDACMQFTQVALRTSIYAVEPTGRNRVNTAFMIMSFLGQLTGTAAGNKLYDMGGWVATGSLSLGLIAGFANFLCLVKGPYEHGWIGWHGGWGRADNRGNEKGNGEKVASGGGKNAGLHSSEIADVEAAGQETRTEIASLKSETGRSRA